MAIPSAPSAPSAQTPAKTSTSTSLLAPKDDISSDVEQMRKQMEDDKLRQRNEESKKLDELLGKVSNNLEKEKQETALDLRQNRDMDNVMTTLHSSFDKLMSI